MQAFFLPAETAAGGQRFALYHPPSGAPRGAVLFVHAFTEEMNKSRRMAALAARALASSGCGVLQLDLYGCGDSSGEFAEATWSDWLADVQRGARWLQQRHPGMPWLWGHRAGCLLAAQAAQAMGGGYPLLFWQAPAAGKPLLQQFLRLKLAGSMQGGAARGSTEALRQALQAGRPVDVAGYLLNPALASGLEAAALDALAPPAGTPVVWLETTAREPAALLPTSAALLERWRGQGCEVAAEAVPGPAFWQTVEIEEAPALVDATVRHVLRASSPAAATP
ncbi:hydrolase 2, exosortase A system-associated [Aquincola agrisoli]